MGTSQSAEKRARAGRALLEKRSVRLEGEVEKWWENAAAFQPADSDVHRAGKGEWLPRGLHFVQRYFDARPAPDGVFEALDEEVRWDGCGRLVRRKTLPRPSRTTEMSGRGSGSSTASNTSIASGSSVDSEASERVVRRRKRAPQAAGDGAIRVMGPDGGVLTLYTKHLVHRASRFNAEQRQRHRAGDPAPPLMAVVLVEWSLGLVTVFGRDGTVRKVTDPGQDKAEPLVELLARDGPVLAVYDTRRRTPLKTEFKAAGDHIIRVVTLPDDPSAAAKPQQPALAYNADAGSSEFGADGSPAAAYALRPAYSTSLCLLDDSDSDDGF